MKRQRRIHANPREMSRTAIGIKIICDWTDKTELHLFFPEEKVWGLVQALEEVYEGYEVPQSSEKTLND